MSSQNDDELFEEIQRSLEQEFIDFGNDLVETIRDRLSEPAQVFTGPRGGKIVIGSEEGEPPCMRTGYLRDSIRFEVINDEDNLRLILLADAEYAPYLDPGLERIIFTGILEEFNDEFQERLSKAVGRR